MEHSKKERHSLNAQQLAAIRMIDEGKNLFITGGAGTGKTLLINEINRIVGSRKRISVTSTTAFSAFLSKGITLHSWSGIGLGNDTVDEIVKKLIGKYGPKPVGSIIISTEILIIDEVSMLSSQIFNLVEKVVRTVKNSEKIFGGLQIVVVGDMYQLPPVSNGNKTNYCFDSELWNKLFNEPEGYVITLTQIFRQSNNLFTSLLERIRRGEPNLSDIDLLKTKVTKNEKIKEDMIYLESKKKEVERINNDKINDLDGKLRVYSAEIIHNKSGGLIVEKKSTILKTTTIAEILPLKIGAKVMLNYNLDLRCGLVNGLTGEIIGFKQSNIPNWSDFDLEILNDNEEEFCKHEDDIFPNTYTKLKNPNLIDLPVVKLDDGRKILVYPKKWELLFRPEYFREKGKLKIRKTPEYIVYQLPLDLAHALTIHKVQGITLDTEKTNCKVCINPSGIFESGQFYVALSRCKSLNGIILKREVNNRVFKQNEKVKLFYENIEQVFFPKKKLIYLLKIAKEKPLFRDIIYKIICHSFSLINGVPISEIGPFKKHKNKIDLL